MEILVLRDLESYKIRAPTYKSGLLLSIITFIIYLVFILAVWRCICVQSKYDVQTALKMDEKVMVMVLAS